jgi:prepilin-type N-terminal cleavage/methylation domain-containing protein
MLLSKTSKGMTLIEMAAVVVVTGIIALGMTMGTHTSNNHYSSHFDKGHPF